MSTGLHSFAPSHVGSVMSDPMVDMIAGAYLPAVNLLAKEWEV